MRTQIKKWLAVAFMAFTLKASMVAQGGPCVPLSPPSWMTVTNITSSSALVQWENVQAGAWYRLELRNLNTGLVEDLSFTQATSKTYYNLAASTDYRVTARVSSCQQGPFGQGAFVEFQTTGIVVEDIVNINQGAQDPNMQNGFNNANTVVNTGDTFYICIKKGTIPISNFDEVLHAYLAPEGDDNDFFEFFMAANTGDNNAYFDSAPLRFPSGKWWYEGGNAPLGPGGQNQGFTNVKVYHINAQGKPELAMKLESTGVISPTGYVMLQVFMGNNYVFTYDLDRESGVCTPAAALKHNPLALAPKDKLQGFFPNPFDDHLNIPDFDQDAGPVAVRVIDSTGRLLFETSEQDAARIVRRINTAGWLPGLYFVQIQTATDATTTPVVKM